ncbi:MAG: PaaI family thioesterase [Acidobacteriota bacterium]
MTEFKEPDPDFARRVRESFRRQAIMGLIGAVLTGVEPGEVEIELPFRPDLTQQHGFLHAGVVTTIVDSACGYAALSLMPADTAVLAVEIKVNFLEPARGEKLIARGRVTRSGRTLSTCAGDVHAIDGPARTHVATALSTVMTITDHAKLRG